MNFKSFLFLVLSLPAFAAQAAWEKELGPYQPTSRDTSGSNGIKFKCTIKELTSTEETQIDLKDYVSGANAALKDATYLRDNFAKCEAGINCKPGQTYLTSTSNANGFLDRSIVEVSCKGLSSSNVYKKEKLDKECWYPNPVPVSGSWPSTSVTYEGVGRCAEDSYDMADAADNRAKKDSDGKYYLSSDNGSYYMIFDDEAAAGSNPIAKLANGNYYKEEYLTNSDLTYELSLPNGDNLGAKDSSAVLPGCEGSSNLCREGALVSAAQTTAFDNSVKFILVLRNRSTASKDVAEIFANGLVLNIMQGGTPLFSGTENLSIVPSSPNLSLRQKITLADFPAAKCELEFAGKNNFDTVGGIKIYKVQAEEVGLFPLITGLPDYLSYSKRPLTNWIGASFARNTAGISAHDIEGNLKFLLKDQIYDVSAKLSFVADPSSQIDCPQVKMKSPPIQNQVNLLTYSQCGLFTKMRRYYLSELAGADKKLLFPGQESNQDLYVPLGRTPFVGLYNIAQRDAVQVPAIANSTVTAANQKQLEFNGLFPAISQLQNPDRPGRYIDRFFKGTFIVARVMSVNGFTPPILWSEIGRDGKFKNVLMESTKGLDSYNVGGVDLKNLPDDTEVVFEIIAKKDEYGRDGSMSPGLFTNNNVDSAKFDVTHLEDKNIPFASGSCLGSMPFRLPQKKVSGSLVAFPTAISGASLCKYSSPMKLGDVKLGKVALETLILTPKSAVDEFPVQLVMANKAPAACSVNNALNASGAPKTCWEIKSYMPPTVDEFPMTDHASCKTVVCETFSRQSTSYYPCGYSTCSATSNYPVTVCRDEYKPSCLVLEKSAVDDDKECEQNMAFRFDGFFNQMTASLGCVAKYDQPTNNAKIRNVAGQAVDLNGVEVSATLLGQGIIPYSTSFISRPVGLDGAGNMQYKNFPMGGADPAAYTSYPKAQKSKDRSENLGYACVPCQFNLPWLGNASHPKNFDVSPLPLDQNSEDNPRIPKYVFNKKTMPADCVKDTTFEVRYFGSGQCTGTNNPSGNFCTSGNITNRNCPSSEGDAGGNKAGKFTVGLCAGSEFGTNNVSASWSPIIIDVAGNGIQVSRESIMAVDFDMEGKGKKMLVDWPLNTLDVGILVEPDKKGNVTSIKQLFGDDKFKNGFEKLKKLDSNKDKLLNIKDKSFTKLRLWFDRNRNGLAEKEELDDLAKHGVNQLSFNYLQSNAEGVNSLTLSSTYFNSNHKKYMNIDDLYFQGYKHRNRPAITNRQTTQAK